MIIRPQPTRVIIACHTILVGEGIYKILKDERNIEVIGEISNRSDIIKYCEQKKPDILILDVDIPNLDITKTLQIVSKRSPQTKVLLLTKDEDDNDSIFNIVGYLTKKVGLSQLTQVIQNTSKDTFWAGGIEQDHERRRLTKRQKEIAKLVAEGYTNKKISQMLSISEKTIKSHLTTIFNKLGIQNRYQLLVIFQREG